NTRKIERKFNTEVGEGLSLKNPTARTVDKILVYKERDSLKKSFVETIPPVKEQNESNSNSLLPTRKSEPVLSNEFISCQELFTIIRDGRNNVLIIDCRSEEDYNSSKLRYDHCVNVPEEIIQSGMTAGTIQGKLSTESKTLWAYRNIKEQVILMDWDSACNKLNGKITILKKILLNWDPDVEYKNPILILNNGYEGFMTFYPASTTKVINRNHWKNQTMEVRLEDIEYSNINEVPMKSDYIFHHQTNNVPVIDRSSKAAAEKLYNSDDLQKEKEKLLDESIHNEQQILNKITELKDQNIQNYNGDEAMLEEVRQQLQNERMELEDRQKELEDRQKELEEWKIKYNLLSRELDEEKVKNVENQKRIAEKERMEEELRMKRQKESVDMDKRQRELEMAARARLQKPRIPTFDRGAKPQPIIDNSSTIVRHFYGQGRAIAAGLTGLANLQNNCYMNNIVQCLSNTTVLAEYFISKKYKQHINRSSETRGRIVEELSAVLKEIWSNDYGHISSIDFRSTVGQYHPMFSGADHQDSHEFLKILIDWMHLDLQTLTPEVPRGNLSAADKAWFAFLKNKESAIFRMFYGQFKSTLKCCVCGCESATYESFSDISLQVPPISRVSSPDIEQCLENFFYGEYIDDWDCPKCKTKRSAIKKLDITRLPKVLVIHFKRFNVEINNDGMLVNSSKNQIHISFPLIGLNMAKHIAPSARTSNMPKQMYNLYGVSNHYGTLTSGHYTAFCKSQELQRWFKFDDKKVTQLEPSNIVTSAAYILFYSNNSNLLL
ncbi:Ubiquitin carboxyl-terminal hydrolase 8, partial [Pseudolycoriella hygida]